MNALGLSKMLVFSGVSSTSLYTSVVGDKFLKENLTSFVNNIQPLMQKGDTSENKPTEKSNIPASTPKVHGKEKPKILPCPVESSTPKKTISLMQVLRPTRTKSLQGVKLSPDPKSPKTKVSSRRR